jgi:type VI secretion system Hcp family effector
MGWSQIYLDIKFKKAGQIRGECEYAGFEDQIVLFDFDWSMGVAQDVRKKNADPQRKASFEPLRLTKRFDSSSIPLYSCMTARDTIESACITVAHAMGNDAGGKLRRAFEIKVIGARMESMTLKMSNQGKSIVVQEDILVRYSKIYFKRYTLGPDGQYGTSAKTYDSRAILDVGFN